MSANKAANKVVKANKAAIAREPVAIVNEPMSLVREPVAIDQVFKRNSLGYLESSIAGDLAIDDAVGYVVHKLEAGQSALRAAILICGYVFKTKTAAQASAFESSLKSRWNGSTLPNLICIAKQLGKFEENGLDLNKVKDLYGVRDCAKLLKSEEHGLKAIAMLNEGKAPRAIKEAIQPANKPSVAPVAPVAINVADEADRLETLILTYVDRYAKIAEHDARLKLTRQIIAKMAIGNYTFLPSDAAKAVETLKAKK